MRVALGEPGFEYRETIASGGRGGGGRRHHHDLARCPTPSRRSTIPPWCDCCARAARRPAGSPSCPMAPSPAAARGEETGRDRAAARGRRGRLHRRQPRHRRRPADAPRAVLRARLRRPRDPAPGGPVAGRAAAAPPRANWPPGSGLPGIPAAAEAIMVARDITPGPAHRRARFMSRHVSTAAALALIRARQGRRARASPATPPRPIST